MVSGKSIGSLLFICMCIPAFGLDTHQKILREDVRTLSVRNNNDFMQPPVIDLNGYNTIDINFDIIGEKHEDLCYRLIHCNSDWQPSSLVESEYLSDFNEYRVEDFEYSYNTFTHYVNYNIRIPASPQSILKSGNYLLQVYSYDNPDSILLQARFMVAEDLATVSGFVSGRTDRGFNDKFQQLELEVALPNNGEIDPLTDLKVTVMQNNRPETERAISTPAFVENGVLHFRHSPYLIFPGGNEYRRFETVRADYAGLNVDSVRFVDNQWHAWITPDSQRGDKPYRYDSTQHGRFKIDEYNSTDPDLSADYVDVHFKLISEEYPETDVYINGDFTNNIRDSKTRMHYNNMESSYEIIMNLKQGSYNYRYETVSKNGGEDQESNIEGDKYETRNEYLVRVYLRKPGDRYDRLIGYKVITID
ncbi:MAG: DUF5103 domain-containing protein [Muribaculaceae bacterium]|nr:DUF5103 domain-containing protein [Muribaculaceae bacterium]